MPRCTTSRDAVDQVLFAGSVTSHEIDEFLFTLVGAGIAWRARAATENEIRIA